MSDAPEQLAQVIMTAVCSTCGHWRVRTPDATQTVRPTPTSWPNPCYPCAIWSRRVQFVTFADVDETDPTDPPSAA